MISFPHLHVPQRQTCYMQTCRTIFLSADYFCSVSKYFAISVWARTGGLARLGLFCLAGRSSGPGFSELCKHSGHRASMSAALVYRKQGRIQLKFYKIKVWGNVCLNASI